MTNPQRNTRRNRACSQCRHMLRDHSDNGVCTLCGCKRGAATVTLNDEGMLVLPEGGPIKWYDRQGAEITPEQAEELMHDQEYRVLKLDHLPTGWWVSTVWLGIDMGVPWPWFAERPPLLFETMLITDDHSDIDVRRYYTEEQALAGHAQAVIEKSSTVD